MLEAGHDQLITKVSPELAWVIGVLGALCLATLTVGLEPLGLGGIAAEHVPSHCTVPVFVWPHEFAAEEHAVLILATQVV